MRVSRKHGVFTGCILVVLIFVPALRAFAGTVHYVYDARSQVTQAEYGDGTMFEYSYDTIGNRVTATTTAAATPTPTPTPTSEQSPYGGTAWAIPGQIEAEDYDVGGEGVAYHDTSSGNEGGTYRSDDVDITGASGTGGGYIGWIVSGEWLEYTVDVNSSGTYDVELLVASTYSGGSCHLEINGVDKTGPINIPNTGDWLTWTTVAVSGISLQAGQQIMRLVIDSSPFNVNWIQFTSSGIPQSPYGGTAWTIPGQIEAEDYDLGGEGVAYHDSSSGNEGGAYRSDDVDIAGTSDTGGGYTIGWIISDEWLEYTVDVITPGTYEVEIRVASPYSGGTCHLEIDGLDTTGPISIPNTGDWQTWTTVTTSGVLLQDGQHIMRLVIDSSPFNVNWIRFTSTGVPQSPYGGTAWEIPGQIEAEDYDLGGEWVAYHDTDSGNSGGVYRSDDVDIYGASDTGGGYLIGLIISGEWLEYTVEVSSSGLYDVEVRVSSPYSGKICHLEFDGVDKTGPISIPNTGDWQNWTTVAVSGISLEAGQQIMRLVMDSGPFSLNWIQFTSSGILMSTMTSISTVTSQPQMVTIQKEGTGTGTIRVGAQECGPDCDELQVPYVDYALLTVIPADGSHFVRLERKDGTPLNIDSFEVSPGETVVVIFEQNE